jgi:hypothetical protein
MNYKYYKFPSKQLAPSLTQWPEDVSVEVIGQIKDTPGVYDENGYEILPPTYIDGWHINVAYQGYVDLSFVQQYEINVHSPRRVWFGQEI